LLTSPGFGRRPIVRQWRWHGRFPVWALAATVAARLARDTTPVRVCK
jgi:hypothetical protein